MWMEVDTAYYFNADGQSKKPKNDGVHMRDIVEIVEKDMSK
jgi:hypothetical protein